MVGQGLCGDKPFQRYASTFYVGISSFTSVRGLGSVYSSLLFLLACFPAFVIKRDLIVIPDQKDNINEVLKLLKDYHILGLVQPGDGVQMNTTARRAVRASLITDKRRVHIVTNTLRLVASRFPVVFDIIKDLEIASHYKDYVKTIIDALVETTCASDVDAEIRGILLSLMVASYSRHEFPA